MTLTLYAYLYCKTLTVLDFHRFLHLAPGVLMDFLGVKRVRMLEINSEVERRKDVTATFYTILLFQPISNPARWCKKLV